jgi:site-specific DNA recombinase
MKEQKTISVACYMITAAFNPADLSEFHSQKQLITQYLDNHPELALVESYCDLGVSNDALLCERPAGSRLLEDAKDKKFDMILVTAIDMLGKDLRVFMDSANSLADFGMKVRSVTESGDTENLEGKSNLAYWQILWSLGLIPIVIR